MAMLLENFPLPTFVIQGGRIQLFNRCFLECTGHKKLTETLFTLLVHYQDRQMVSESLQKALEGEGALICKFRLLVKDDIVMHVRGFFQKSLLGESRLLSDRLWM